jgi:hypothetical protein
VLGPPADAPDAAADDMPLLLAPPALAPDPPPEPPPEPPEPALASLKDKSIGAE